ncbi:MAG: putative Na(+)/H(+) antiporter [Holophagaceae bacterium]|nr:putative Na(+)/H(+) antiporter [Holophagaceae bacterium]
MNIPAVVVLIGLLIFLAHALDDLFARTKIPDVLLLLGLGLLLGPVSKLMTPSDLGAVGPIFSTLTLIIILFEGGLGLDLRVLARSVRGATGLTIWSFLGTMLVVTPVGHILLGLSWLGASTLGAILGGTSSAVVIPMVKRLAVSPEIRAVLSIESALSDVLVIVVALGLMGAQAMGSLKVGHLMGGMLASFLLAGILGAAGGVLWSLALNRMHSLQRSIFTTPAFVLVMYGLVELLGYSGAIASLSLGIVLGNIDLMPLGILRRSPETLASLSTTEKEVFAEVVFLLKTFFFIYIGLSLRLTSLNLALGGLGITALLFALRIPVVHGSLSTASTTRFEAATAAAMTPKGLAAAVLASVPTQMGLPGGSVIQTTVYALILFSILATSLLVFLLERGWLDPCLRRIFRRYAEHPEVG